MGMSGVGPSELVVILLIALLLFGSKRLKTLGGDVGEAIRSFRAAMHGSGHEAAKPHPGREPERALAASPAGSVGAPARGPTAPAPAPQDAPHKVV